MINKWILLSKAAKLSYRAGPLQIKEMLHAAEVPEHLANTKTFRHSYNERGKLHGTPDYVRRAFLGHRTQAANDYYGMLVGGDLRDHAREAWGEMV